MLYHPIHGSAKWVGSEKGRGAGTGWFPQTRQSRLFRGVYPTANVLTTYQKRMKFTLGYPSSSSLGCPPLG